MPISRVLFEDVFAIGGFHFLPPGYADIRALNPSENVKISTLANKVYQGHELREFTSSLTGFGLGVLETSNLIAFSTNIDSERFESYTHQEDISLLKNLSDMAEKAMDVIRFDYCRLDLPDTLPGQVGSWEGSSDYLGALIYDPISDKARLIAGSAVESSKVVKGIGLDMNSCSYEPLIKSEDGELAAIFTHGLMLLSDAMTSQNETVKFVRVMSLLEFLGNPHEYESWKKLKGKIASHLAMNKSDYYRIIARFRELTSDKGQDGEDKGLRTQIVHNGKSLSQLVQEPDDRCKLFRELQIYITAVLRDVRNMHESTWEDLVDWRSDKLQQLGIR